jgi:hypothetical protein
MKVDFAQDINPEAFINAMNPNFIHTLSQYKDLAYPMSQQEAIPFIGMAGGDTGNYYLILQSMKGRLPSSDAENLLEILVDNMGKLVTEAIGKPITLEREKAVKIIDDIILSYINLKDYFNPETAE